MATYVMSDIHGYLNRVSDAATVIVNCISCQILSYEKGNGRMLILLFLSLVLFTLGLRVYIQILYNGLFEENDRLSHTISDFNTQIVIDKNTDNVYYIQNGVQN